MFFMLTEAAVGAGLVLFRLVADNASFARAMFMAVHLVNTFLLLGCLTVTAWWLSGGAPVRFGGRGRRAAGVLIGCAAVILASTSGAVAALGDTLFPSASLGQALSADLSMASHILIRLRVLHPVVAAAAALGLLTGAPHLVARGDLSAERAARAVRVFAATQIALGFLNVLLLAPVWLQLVHLLIADAIWIAFVLLAAIALGQREGAAASAEAA
jgi:heme A synthase